MYQKIKKAIVLKQFDNVDLLKINYLSEIHFGLESCLKSIFYNLGRCKYF